MRPRRAGRKLVHIDVEERVDLHPVGADVDEADPEPAGVVEGAQEVVRDVHPLAVGGHVHHDGKFRFRNDYKGSTSDFCNYRRGSGHITSAMKRTRPCAVVRDSGQSPRADRACVAERSICTIRFLHPIAPKKPPNSASIPSHTSTFGSSARNRWRPVRAWEVSAMGGPSISLTSLFA
jgi:hypothetical protein